MPKNARRAAALPRPRSRSPPPTAATAAAATRVPTSTPEEAHLSINSNSTSANTTSSSKDLRLGDPSDRPTLRDPRSPSQHPQAAPPPLLPLLLPPLPPLLPRSSPRATALSGPCGNADSLSPAWPSAVAALRRTQPAARDSSSNQERAKGTDDAEEVCGTEGATGRRAGKWEISASRQSRRG